jgi:hypothetical protein
VCYTLPIFCAHSLILQSDSAPPKPQFVTGICTVLYLFWAQIIRLCHELGYFRWNRTIRINSQQKKVSLRFQMDQFSPRLINYSKILTQLRCWCRKVRTLVSIFEHQKANVYFSLQFLFFPYSKNEPEILCLLKFSSKISSMHSCLLYLNNSLLPIFDIQIFQTWWFIHTQRIYSFVTKHQ